MADRLIIFGCGGHAKVVAEAVLQSDRDREIVILDDADQNRSRSVFGIPVRGGRGELEILRGTPVALGIGDNHARSQLLSWLTEQRHTLESVIHPAAVVGPSVQIGAGAFVGAGAIAIAEARVGAAAILNTGATVDHDCDIGEAAHVGPGVHLCGNVRVGARALVGVGSSVRPGISIADDAVVGAGSVVVRDITVAGTFAGNPARSLDGV